MPKTHFTLIGRVVSRIVAKKKEGERRKNGNAAGSTAAHNNKTNTRPALP